MKPRVNTDHYEIAWGKKPRGRGSWAFDLGNHGGTVADHEPFWFNGSYGDAKKAALKAAKERGSAEIIVLS